jgi:alkylhydroperoxidase/carboxymuconolactone decarboxylase family protein YurZ
MQDTIESPDELPSGAAEIARAYPAIWRAFAGLGKACGEAGPLDRRTIRLVKLALSLGALSEGAVHSHTRRALAQGLSPDELKHVALLAIPTLGLPQAVKGLTWIEDITDDRARKVLGKGHRKTIARTTGRSRPALRSAR